MNDKIVLESSQKKFSLSSIEDNIHGYAFSDHVEINIHQSILEIIGGVYFEDPKEILMFSNSMNLPDGNSCGKLYFYGKSMDVAFLFNGYCLFIDPA